MKDDYILRINIDNSLGPDDTGTRAVNKHNDDAFEITGFVI